jgi:L-lactate dehydrogenase complex protein LldG
MTDTPDIIAKIRRALGRSAPLSAPPSPPLIAEPITRLVYTDLGLPHLFATRAAANNIGITPVYIGDLHERLIAYLREHDCRRIAIPASRFLDKLDIPAVLRQAHLEVRRWDQLTVDELYGFDCGLTDVYAAVAETGSLVIRPSPSHGRAISLVPTVHVAIIEPRNLLPDLVDLFEKLSHEGLGSGCTLISGPSKTADIEMNLVTGMHGPGTVHAFILE